MFCRRTSVALLVASLLIPSSSFAQEAPSPEEETADPESANQEQPDPLGEWVATFPGDAAASYFATGDNASVIVVAAGGHAEAEMAADTLEKALRQSGRFELVMNDDVLADNAKVDDETIVGKAEHLPVSQVADKHNRKLRKELGLPEDVSDGQASKLKWSVGLTGNGAMLRVEF
ncbi:hypothetical protein FIV42_13560 [Persicimonas caeni]|uniref:Uncharacterized protein n=1 Tax=Persicimonas caeni TaxID=2292766 RepID=A0A4Y6PUQ1_PERCE|nr:hypothetical protein [Persicimonas caeni]QDG51737.1 hypothetical protein FIV42_13560 [Persicimonas caeni]QED32958.1 hypothetical protein FRD00_13555 [Persicimonas caeni]